jgi:hypothetical protein
MTTLCDSLSEVSRVPVGTAERIGTPLPVRCRVDAQGTLSSLPMTRRAVSPLCVRSASLSEPLSSAQIKYDAVSQRYVTLSNPQTNMPHGFDQRNVLALTISQDLRFWLQVRPGGGGGGG